jgi:site-specific recombinase XerD
MGNYILLFPYYSPNAMPKKTKNDCSFFLKDTKGHKPTVINFHMNIPGEPKPLKRSIGKAILPGQWDFEDQRPLPSKDKALREIEQLIQSIIDVIPVIKAACKRNNRLISKAEVNAALDVLLQSKQADKAPEQLGERNMFTDFETIIAGMKDGSILTPGKNKKRYKAPTIKNYEKRSLPKIREFYKDRKHAALWAGVTIDMYDEFIAWCHTKDLSNNSIGVYVKCWKRAGKIALKKGWHTNAVFNDEDFMALKEETDDIYLDETKIEKLYKQACTEKKYEVARDWFVLDCNLGLRVSDLRRVAIDDFAGDYFQFVNNKTGAQVAIKINRFVKAIIKKWKGLPPPMTDVEMNKHIKVIARAAGLKKKIIYKITKGGELKSETLEEWQMISSHNARRSFITNLLKLGIPHAQVMKLAGIKRYDTLMRYFKQTAEEVAQETGKNEFFS